MGRGGEAVFALDVTDRTAPRLLWEISSADSDFADLGQTWSPPVAARVRIGGTTERRGRLRWRLRPGTGQPDVSRRTPLATPSTWSTSRLASASGVPEVPTLLAPTISYCPACAFSIPAPVRPLDLNADGLAERFYVGDMGGQLWRFDIVNGENAGTLVEGGILASLGGAAGSGPPRPPICAASTRPPTWFRYSWTGNC